MVVLFVIGIEERVTLVLGGLRRRVRGRKFSEFGGGGRCGDSRFFWGWS